MYYYIERYNSIMAQWIIDPTLFEDLEEAQIVAYNEDDEGNVRIQTTDSNVRTLEQYAGGVDLAQQLRDNWTEAGSPTYCESRERP
jgi:hypothetical protein